MKGEQIQTASGTSSRQVVAIAVYGMALTCHGEAHLKWSSDGGVGGNDEDTPAATPAQRRTCGRGFQYVVKAMETQHGTYHHGRCLRYLSPPSALPARALQPQGHPAAAEPTVAAQGQHHS